jgi:tight adherence protein B
MRELLIALVSVALVAALEGARQLRRWSVDQKADELRRRLRSLGTDLAAGGGPTLLRQGRFARTQALDAFLRRIPLAHRMERLLEQADSRFTVAQLFAWSGLSAAAGFVFGTLLGLGLVALLTAAGGLLVPTALLAVGRDRRSRKVSEQLPEALDMMARSLRAGHALTAAFEVVASEMPDPVAVEFGRAFESQKFGLPAERAIAQMTERVPGNRDLKIFAVSAAIQRETGGNMAEILGNIAETIRARYRFYGKLRALTAEGRASGAVLGGLPIVVALVLRVVNPKYLVPLFTTPGGHAILAFAATIWIVGLTWLYRLTQLDV